MSDDVHKEHCECPLVFLRPGEFVDVKQEGVFCKVKLLPVERMILDDFAGRFAGGNRFESYKVINSRQAEGVI